MEGALLKLIANAALKLLRGVLALLYALVIGVYLLIARTFLYAVTVYAVLYFALATTPARDAITQLVSGAIPGILTTSSIQWGPFPSSLILCDVAIQNEHNEHTIRVGALETEIDLAGMVSGLTALTLLPSAPLPVLFRSATFVDADVKMRIDDEGRIDLVRAFHIRRLDEKPGPPPNNRIIIANAKFINARYRLETEDLELDVRGADINLEHFRVEREDDFSFRVSQLNAQQAELALKPQLVPVSSLQRVVIPVENVDIKDFQFDIHRFHARRAQGVLDGGTLDATLSMNFVDGPTPLWDLSAALSLPSTSTLVSDLTGDVATGDVQATLRALGSMRDFQGTFDVRSEAMEIAGYPLKNLEASGGIRPAISPDNRLNHPVYIDRLEADALGGKVTLSPGVMIPRWAAMGGLSSKGDRLSGPGRVGIFSGSLEVAGVDPAQITENFGVEAQFELPSPLIRSRLDGKFNLSGHVDERSRGLRLDLETEDLKLSLAESVFGWGIGKPVTLSGAVGYERGPPGHAPPQGGQFKATHQVELNEFELRQGSDAAEVDATIDLEERSIDLWGRVDLPGLKRLLGAFEINDISGQAKVTGLRITGPWLNPRVRGKLRVGDTVIYAQDGGDIEADLDIRDGLLKLKSVATRASWGRASASGQIRLWRGRFDQLDKRMPFKARNVIVRELQLDNLMPEIGISARVSVKADRVDGEATRLLETIEGVGTIRGTQVKLGVDEAQEVIAKLEANARTVRAKDIRVTLASGDDLLGSLTFYKNQQRLSAQLKTEALPFTSIEYLDHAGIPLRGQVTSSLELEGTLKDPIVIGTVSFQDLAIEPLKLGSGSFNVIPAGDGRLEFVAEEGRDLPGLKLLEDSYMTFADGAPERVVFRIEAQEANVYDNLPFMAIPDTTLTASGFVEVVLTPGAEREAWTVVVDAAPNKVRLRTLSDDLSYTNLSEVFLSIDPDGLFIAPFAVGRNASDAMSICGTYGERSAWDLHLTGKLSLDLIGPLRDLFSVSEGYLAVGADLETAASIGDNRCLPGAADNVLRITGELSSPSIAGRLAFEDVVLVPRSLSRELRVAPDASVLIRPGKRPGLQRLELGSGGSDHLLVQVDDGSVELSGVLELQDLAFDSGTLRAVGTDLFYNAIGEYRLSFNPDLTLVVADFQDNVDRRLALSGKVQITEGVYYKNFDSFGQAFTGGGDMTDTSVPLVEQVPWLKALTLDLNMFGESFQVTSEYTGGAADIDTSFNLQVLGTLEDLRVEDRLVVQPGGTLTYDLIGREFEVVRGTLDFKGEAMRPSTDVELTTEVNYEVQSSNEDLAEERVVNVSVGITGVLPNLVIALWSRDAVGLDQADLQSLILTGRPRDDAASLQNTLGISFDFGDLLSNVIQAPLFEAFKARVGPQGTVTTQIVTEFGRAVRLHAKVTQAADETHVLAGFKFLLSDNLSLEGSLQRTDRALNPTQTYEARFKYRIPLD